MFTLISSFVVCHPILSSAAFCGFIKLLGKTDDEKIITVRKVDGI